MREPRWSDPVAATIIARLDKIGPHRIARLVGRRRPSEALAALVAGEGVPRVPPALLRGWRRTVESVDPAAVRAELEDRQVRVSWTGSEGHPSALEHDLDPAPVLFRQGKAFDGATPAVAIVGTRRASGVGREVARELGFGLSAAGVTVVSGLALGIDGAAHEGALTADGAPPVAFVGGGVDVVYPRRHADLWSRVRRSGTIISEAPPGAAPLAWRFPARNRLIAAVVDVVVVVESRRAGGSLLTVDEAVRRDRQVMAVPGSLRNPAAEGTNALLSDGCAPVLDVDDVLVALGLSQVACQGRRAIGPASDIRLPPKGSVARQVLDACGDGPASSDVLVDRSGLAADTVLTAVGHLVANGALVEDGARFRLADRAAGRVDVTTEGDEIG